MTLRSSMARGLTPNSRYWPGSLSEPDQSACRPVTPRGVWFLSAWPSNSNPACGTANVRPTRSFRLQRGLRHPAPILGRLPHVDSSRRRLLAFWWPPRTWPAPGGELSAELLRLADTFEDEGAPTQGNRFTRVQLDRLTGGQLAPTVVLGVPDVGAVC